MKPGNLFRQTGPALSALNSHVPLRKPKWIEGQYEMETTSGEGWAELQPDGSLEGEISFQNRDETSYIATKW